MTKAELNNPDFPSIIAEPVWDNEVQWFFREDYDVPHMKGIIDLASYQEVSSLSAKIYYYVYYKMMPAPWGPKPTPWNENKAFSFRNWLTHGCPKDQAALDAFKKKQAAIAEDTSLRHRKNINDIQGVEKENLLKAFQGIMDLDNNDPNSFYQLGGIHWYPAPTYCEHHIHPFLAWHRAYILQFENALRAIPGCEDVTLPYWDISDDRYPEIFSEGPFVTYKVPQEFINQYPQEVKNGSLKADGSIIRNDAASYNEEKWKYLRDAAHDPTNTNKVYLDKIIQFPTWNAFNGLTNKGVYVASESLMHAHDMIHNCNGATTANQDVTGFEPVFWLFHANWDRLMWQWQKLHHTTNLDDFKKNVKACGDTTNWIDGVGLNIMDPFTDTLGLTVDQTIDLNKMGVNYVEPPLPLTKPENFSADEMSSHRSANKGQSNKNEFTLSNMSYVSLRVKDVNRLKIPGSFTVSLYLGGELLQRRFFFQATEPGNCANCVKQALVSFDFEFENERLQKADGKVKVEIQLSRMDEEGNRPVIPFSEIGNPTINIRLIH
ncbi:tyrosinase family protein [Cyclobacterium plantarum]|uniref:tyrosinase family protein n=1 Tax=Cyclobacterium plantarum TaxID=2716263 RepID=UPI003F70A57C